MHSCTHAKHRWPIFRGIPVLAAVGIALLATPSLGAKGGGKGPPPPDDPPSDCCTGTGSVDVYADSNGDGVPDDGEFITSFADIASALADVFVCDALTCRLELDHLLILQDGCYDEVMVRDPQTGGATFGIVIGGEDAAGRKQDTDGHHLTLCAAEGAQVCLGSANSEEVVSRIRILDPADNVTIKGLTVSNAFHAGIEVRPGGGDMSLDNILEGLTIQDCAIDGLGAMNSGIDIKGPSRAHGVLLSGNTIHDVDTAIWLRNGQEQSAAVLNTLTGCDVGIFIQGTGAGDWHNQDGWILESNILDCSTGIVLGRNNVMPINTDIVDNDITASGNNQACIKLGMPNDFVVPRSVRFADFNALCPTNRAVVGVVKKTKYSTLADWRGALYDDGGGNFNDANSTSICP